MMRVDKRIILPCLLFVGAAFVDPAPLRGQGVVISGSSSAQYIELRPLAIDSVAYAQTDSAWGYYRRTASGLLVRCTTPDVACTYFRSATRQSLAAMMQDVDLTAWGLGQGISVHAQVRGRTAVGDARDIWPQATQPFEVISAYVDLDRSLGRLRVGRQWVTSTLGVFNFDGADVALRPVPMLAADFYGGGALVEGLNQPLDASALTPVEDIPPTDRAYLLGGTFQLRPSPAAALRVQYQREIRSDRSALYSERLAATGEVHTGDATLSGQVTRDMATGQYNDLTASIRLPVAYVLDGTLTARHYAPYFDLWTIWGAFSPVAFNELTGEVRWASRGGLLSLGATGGWRAYDDTHTGVATLPLRNDGWRAGGSAAFRATPTVFVQGSYDADIGFGASGSDADAAVRWMPDSRVSFALHASAFQTVDEFQVGQGRVFGGGAEGDVQLTSLVRAVGEVFIYRHDAHEQPALVNWNQRRASIRIEWTLGGEPGWGTGGIGKARPPRVGAADGGAP